MPYAVLGKAALEGFQFNAGAQLKPRHAKAGRRRGFQGNIVMIKAQAEEMGAITTGLHHRGAHDVRVIAEFPLQICGIEFGIAEFVNQFHVVS